MANLTNEQIEQKEQIAGQLNKKEMSAEVDNMELSDDDLDDVAGGLTVRASNGIGSFHSFV